MRRWTRTLVVGVIGCVAAGSVGAGALLAKKGGSVPRLQFLGQAILDTTAPFNGTKVGGLSSIAYDASLGVFYALSDDQGQFSGTYTPARFYTLRINLSTGQLHNGDVTIAKVTTLLAPNGSPYPAASLDPEGLTLTRDGELIVTSEGIASSGVAPWVRRYSLDGTFLDDLFVPAAFLPTSSSHGVRQNLAFEAAAVTPKGRHLFVGMEGALVQDGPPATLTNGSLARLLRYDLKHGDLDRQYLYPTDTIAEPPIPSTQFAVNGLVEVLPLDKNEMLTMERSFSVGAPGTGNTIKLYTASLAGATNVNGLDTVAGLKKVRTVDKRLLLDLRSLKLPLDNIEGMTLGPVLPDGRQSLILVSDDNFAASQFTQFLLFAIERHGHGHGHH